MGRAEALSAFNSPSEFRALQLPNANVKNQYITIGCLCSAWVIDHTQGVRFLVIYAARCSSQMAIAKIIEK